MTDIERKVVEAAVRVRMTPRPDEIQFAQEMAERLEMRGAEIRATPDGLVGRQILEIRASGSRAPAGSPAKSLREGKRGLGDPSPPKRSCFIRSWQSVTVDHAREFPPLPEGGLMQILHPFAGSLSQYAEEIADPDRHRPDHCPQCQAQHALTAHGFYSRTLVDTWFDGSIRVRRYLCRSCKRTVSLLPEFALPYLVSVFQSCRGLVYRPQGLKGSLFELVCTAKYTHRGRRPNKSQNESVDWRQQNHGRAKQEHRPCKPQSVSYDA